MFNGRTVGQGNEMNRKGFTDSIGYLYLNICKSTSNFSCLHNKDKRSAQTKCKDNIFGVSVKGISVFLLFLFGLNSLSVVVKGSLFRFYLRNALFL